MTNDYGNLIQFSTYIGIYSIVFGNNSIHNIFLIGSTQLQTPRGSFFFFLMS